MTWCKHMALAVLTVRQSAGRAMAFPVVDDDIDDGVLLTQTFEFAVGPHHLENNLESHCGSPILWERKMDQKFVDAITNVRLVSGTIRIDLMNITGQTEDNKLQFSKTGELILSQQAFGQALSTMQEVDAEIKKRSAAADDKKKKS